MHKRILLAGIGGGLTLMLWAFVSNGLFGFRSRVDLNRIPDESRVYAVLKERIVAAFAAPMIAAWLLSCASDRVLSRYSRRVIFFVAIGLLVAVFGDLPKLGIGGHPPSSALLLSAYDVVSWTLCGLVAAWVMRGAPSA